MTSQEAVNEALEGQRLEEMDSLELLEFCLKVEQLAGVDLSKQRFCSVEEAVALVDKLSN